MEEVSGDGGGVAPAVATPQPLTVSGSFKDVKSSSRRRASVRPSLDADEFMNLLHGSDPVKVELNRLENEVRGDKCGSIRRVLELILLCFRRFNCGCLRVSVSADKDRELSEAQTEIKALKLSERLREKAVEEVTSNFHNFFCTHCSWCSSNDCHK